MDRDKTNPVWDVYDLFRTARLNVKYFSGKLNKLQKLNLWMEFILAATASSSAIAAFALWHTPIGSKIWQVLSSFAALLAIAKPLLKLTEKIRKIEEVITGYRVLEHDLKKIEISIRQQQSYDKKLKDMFLSALDRMGQLVIKYNEEQEDKKLKKICQAEVLKELPADDFYIPKKGNNE